MFLLDTDHLSILQGRSQPAYDKLVAAMSLHDPSEFCLSLPTIHEQMMGANTYISRSRNASGVIMGYGMMESCLRDFQHFQVLPFGEAAARCFKDLGNKLRVGTIDRRIASIALANGLTVLTRNTVDFSKIPNLLVEDWTQ